MTVLSFLTDAETVCSQPEMALVRLGSWPAAGLLRGVLDPTAEVSKLRPTGDIWSVEPSQYFPQNPNEEGCQLD